MGMDSRLFSREVLNGALVNRARRIYYPVYGGVPRMLVFPTRSTLQFNRTYAATIAQQLAGYTLPMGVPQPGETDVLRNFSTEWLNYKWNDRSYWSLTPESVFDTMHFALDLAHHPVNDQLVLEAGIGIGGTADYLAREHECELVGIDLSYAVDAAFRQFGRNRFLHIVQASVFAPPFAESAFDLVFSQGVIHHTFSTKAAFDRLARLPREDRGRLYVWVYSPNNERRSGLRRALMWLESMMRPVCSRLPAPLQTLALSPLVPLYLLHQNAMASRVEAQNRARYGVREAMHAARDRFTPRYAHRHTEAEVTGWFSAAGYQDLRCLSQHQAPRTIPIDLVACTGVEGVRRPSGRG
jgi:hypothetical protein